MSLDSDFNSIQFEKKLSNLKDSQDSINVCCLWCLENRQHHKKIVLTWLNVLKRVRIEQRLTLFYLANDVIQYSKRKSYEFVESWGTALQKATTMVRDEKVKHKILRIFKIWEQRGVYGEEFITDLSGLISASPTSKKIDESHEFQSSHLINKIRNCAKLEQDTDNKLRLFKQHNPKLLDGEALVSSLKDRAHVDDVEKEMDDYVQHMESYVNALKLEIKSRNNLINLLLNAETQLEKDRKDVKVVAVAYKSFATRVKNLKKKLDEKKSTLSSPVPSPDINAPSPSPDSDIELPEIECTKNVENFSFTNAGFYNPVSSAGTETTNSFVNNGFSSFIGSNMPFNMQNLDTSTLFSNNGSNDQTQTTDSNYNSTHNSISTLFPSISQPPPPPAPVPPVTNSYQYSNPMPLIPPPLPPFTKSDSLYGTDGMYNDYGSDQNSSYGDSTYSTQTPLDPYQVTNTNYNSSYNDDTPTYTPTNISNYDSTAPPPQNDQSYPYDPYQPDEYNPEEEPETWDNEEQWDQPPVLDTPASPPPLDKEAFLDPIEYHDGQDVVGAVDVDHRVINIGNNSLSEKKKDIDHRNLISLTGSPKDSSDNRNISSWSTKTDQDYRIHNTKRARQDQDYRPPFSGDSLNLPPPPPPPANLQKKNSQVQSPRKMQDNIESIDMELSDDEASAEANVIDDVNDKKDFKQGNGALLPPPPFPDDVDANNFLNSLDDQCYEDQNYEDDYEMYSMGNDEPAPNWNNNVHVPLNEVSPVQIGLLGDHPVPMNELAGWVEMPPGMPYQQDMRFRGRGRGNRGHFGGNRGEFNNRGNFRGRGFRGGMNKFRGAWGMDQRGKSRGRARGRPWGFAPRGNFRGGGYQ